MYKSSIINNKGKSKGAISVYTLIISSIILLLSVYVLSLQYESYLHSLNYVKILKNENFDLDKKEHLKNQLYTILHLNVKEIKEENLQKFLNSEDKEKILFKEGADSITLKKGFIRINYEDHTKFMISEDFKVETKNNDFILIKKEY